jgi:peroxiredoxin 2/4
MMAVVPGMVAPEFKGQAVMPSGDFKEISLSDYKGKYVILLFYPMDFTYVCPTEIVAFNKAVEELNSRNVQIIGCSTDSHFVHKAWTARNIEQGGVGKLDFPLLSDKTHIIAKSYGCYIADVGIALRGLYLIDREGVIRHMVINDLPFGRNVEEAIRMVDSVQHHEKHGEVCPANWKKGQQALKPTSEAVAHYMKTVQ